MCSPINLKYESKMQCLFLACSVIQFIYTWLYRVVTFKSLNQENWTVAIWKFKTYNSFIPWGNNYWSLYSCKSPYINENIYRYICIQICTIYQVTLWHHPVQHDISQNVAATKELWTIPWTMKMHPITCPKYMCYKGLRVIKAAHYMYIWLQVTVSILNESRDDKHIRQ